METIGPVAGNHLGGRLEAIRAALGKEFDEVLNQARRSCFRRTWLFMRFTVLIEHPDIDLDALLGEMERRGRRPWKP